MKYALAICFFFIYSFGSWAQEITPREYLLKASKKYNVNYTQGNLNNHIGVPLSLLKIKKDSNFAVSVLATICCSVTFFSDKAL